MRHLRNALFILFILPMTALAEGEVSPGLDIIGFFDFTFSDTDTAGATKGFNEGQLALHFTSRLAPQLTFFAETTFTARADAGTGNPSAPGFNPEVERAILRYAVSDQLKFSFGRYHTPINWWNTTYHHGLWLQTTITRPEMIKFGGKVLPVHFVGASIEGMRTLQGWEIGYQAGLGNGRGNQIGRAGDAGDINNHRAVTMNLYAKPLPALSVGLSAYRDQLLVSSSEFKELITAGYLIWEDGQAEFISEYANIAHRASGSSNYMNQPAYYLQAAYRLPWWNEGLKPYYRYEYVQISSDDAAFSNVPGLKGHTAGLRYDFSDLAAIKTELRRQQITGKSAGNGGFIQISFTF